MDNAAVAASVTASARNPSNAHAPSRQRAMTASTSAQAAIAAPAMKRNSALPTCTAEAATPVATTAAPAVHDGFSNTSVSMRMPKKTNAIDSRFG